MISLRILQKACQTNPHFDKLGQIERAHEILSLTGSSSGSNGRSAAMGGHLRPLFEYMNRVAATTSVAGA